MAKGKQQAKANKKKQTQQKQNPTWVWAAIVIVGLLVLIVWQSQAATLPVPFKRGNVDKKFLHKKAFEIVKEIFLKQTNRFASGRFVKS